MPERLLKTMAAEWSDLAVSLGVDLTRPRAVVSGERAGEIAAALHLAGAGAVTGETIGFALLGVKPPDQPGLDALEPSSVDTIILNNDWADARGLRRVVAMALQALSPGGHLVVSEMAATELVSADPTRYPSAALYRRRPDIGRTVIRDHVAASQLVLALGAVGLKDLAETTFDATLDTDSGGLRRWRHVESADPADLDAADEVLAVIRKRKVSAAHREPWFAVVGRV